MQGIFAWQGKLVLWKRVDASEIGDKRDKAFLINIQPPVQSKIDVFEIYT